MKKVRRYDYMARRIAIAQLLGTNDIEAEITRLYADEKLSALEISEKLAQGGVAMTPRSIQRIVKASGAIRERGDSFRLAIKRGRVQWAYKDPRFKARRGNLHKGLRLSILMRDGYKCVLCGVTAQTSILEVDHIVAKVNGGGDEPTNLRTLCHDCNVGKRLIEQEK